MYKILSILLSIFVLSTAYAETLVGPYLGAGIGYAYVSHRTDHNFTDNLAAAINVVFGYSVSEYFAADAGVALMPDEIYIKKADKDPYYYQTTTNAIVDVAVRASLPFSPFVNGYIHLGPGAVVGNKYIAQGTNYGLFTGIGAKFKVSHNLGMTVEDYGILMPRAIVQNINVISVGIVYEF